jgi:predicted small lipoprotein YifL
VIGKTKKGFTQSHRGTEKNRQGTKAPREICARERAIRSWRLNVFAFQRNPLRLRDSVCKTNSAAIFVRLLIAFALMLPVAACGTKTELLLPNGKPAPRDQRDPSQPPSPISR